MKSNAEFEVRRKMRNMEFEKRYKAHDSDKKASLKVLAEKFKGSKVVPKQMSRPQQLPPDVAARATTPSERSIYGRP